jgi:glucosamine-6-phosphate deaminase
MIGGAPRTINASRCRAAAALLGCGVQVRMYEDAEAVGQAASAIICDAVRAKPDTVLGLPTGTTPIPLYTELARIDAGGGVDFSRATAYAIDEFAGVARDAPGTNAAFFREHLHVGLRALHVPDAAAADPQAEIEAFAARLRKAGGFDLCVLGVGTNGHIAFNEPGSPADAPARVVELAPKSRAAHADAFGGLERVPARGMTLGIADVRASRRILELATGAAKAPIVAGAIEGPVTADVPASWLQAHANVTWLLDRTAASGLKEKPRMSEME